MSFLNSLKVKLVQNYTGKYDNSVVIILTHGQIGGTERMVVVRDAKKKTWNVPGGQRDRGERDSWVTALRELREETEDGQLFPGITLRNCTYHGLHVINNTVTKKDSTTGIVSSRTYVTVVHVCSTTDNIVTGNIKNNETDFVGLLRVDHLMTKYASCKKQGGILEVECLKNKHNVRGCFKAMMDSMCQ